MCECMCELFRRRRCDTHTNSSKRGTFHQRTTSQRIVEPQGLLTNCCYCCWWCLLLKVTESLFQSPCWLVSLSCTRWRFGSAPSHSMPRRSFGCCISGKWWQSKAARRLINIELTSEWICIYSDSILSEQVRRAWTKPDESVFGSLEEEETTTLTSVFSHFIGNRVE